VQGFYTREDRKISRSQRALERLSRFVGTPDFHGPDISPDRHLGMVSMTPEALEALERRRP